MLNCVWERVGSLADSFQDFPEQKRDLAWIVSTCPICSWVVCFESLGRPSWECDPCRIAQWCCHKDSSPWSLDNWPFCSPSGLSLGDCASQANSSSLPLSIWRELVLRGLGGGALLSSIPRSGKISYSKFWRNEGVSATSYNWGYLIISWGKTISLPIIMQQESPHYLIIVFGPPACGKSTLARHILDIFQKDQTPFSSLLISTDSCEEYLGTHSIF